jgi:hypothetical protein
VRLLITGSFFSWFDVMIATVVRLIEHRSHQGSSLSLLSGVISYLIWDYMAVAINLMLGGELLAYSVAGLHDIDLTQITCKSS